MNTEITKISDSDFDSLVLFPRKPAVVFFSAKWSETSFMIRPFLEAAAEKFRGKAYFYELDTDENPIIPIAYGVRRVPAVLTFAGGSFIESYVGTITEAGLNKKIERLTASGKIYPAFAAFSKKLATRIGNKVGLLFSGLF